MKDEDLKLLYRWSREELRNAIELRLLKFVKYMINFGRTEEILLGIMVG